MGDLGVYCNEGMMEIERLTMINCQLEEKIKRLEEINAVLKQKIYFLDDKKEISEDE